REGRPWRRVGLVMVALIVVAGAAAAVIVTQGTGTQQSPPSTPASNAPVPGPGFQPSHVTVAVLNGTATNQLAHRVAGSLAAKGYKEGRIATASNQTVSTTEVAYLPGATNRADALQVARALHLRSADVTPVDQAARAVACPPPGACTANVVVTVGADLAQS
ncbi:MAG TPA: LytR C-terminal domain-containing protein, partial [Solirubrobacteraceae bacterium]|nr:LytR C-terminal domain-containing protein [Solirubrobacteraceae bacterium]